MGTVCETHKIRTNYFEVALKVYLSKNTLLRYIGVTIAVSSLSPYTEFHVAVSHISSGQVIGAVSRINSFIFVSEISIINCIADILSKTMTNLYIESKAADKRFVWPI